MKRKIGIGLIVILNLTFIYIISMGAILTFGIIVVPLGQDRGLEIANQTTKDLLLSLTLLSLIVLLINYFLTKKMINNRKPFLISMTVTLVGLIAFVPFFLSARQSFLNYQNGTTQLRHYLNSQTITEAQVINQADTFQVKQLNDFLTEIGYAKYKRGLWKYAKTTKLIFKRTDGSKDSLFTNGQMFGAYNGKYFSTEQNVVNKYIDKL